MKRLPFIVLLLTIFITLTSAQTATKIDEFPFITCGDYSSRMDRIYFELKNNPQNKVYVIYYEGKIPALIYNKETKKSAFRDKNPQFGNALNRAKEVPLYIQKLHKLPNSKIVLIDGGFRERFGLEIWSVPEGAEKPNSTPNLERKDIKFRKGKPLKPRNMWCCYGSC